MNPTQGAMNGANQSAGGPPPHRVAMDAAADTLGIEPAELRQLLDEGNSLSDLAGAAGVTIADLKSAMTAAVEQAAPAAVAERVTSKLDSIIAGDRPKGPPPGPPPAGGGSESTAVDAFTEFLESLAEALETDTESLVESIENGSFAGLLERSGFATNVGLVVDQKL